MNILFDVEPFDTPKANLKLLDVFFHIKSKIIQSLLPIKEKIILCDGSLIIIFTPSSIGIDHINIDNTLSKEIYQLIGENIDFSQIAKDLLTFDSN
ncbi:MAG: hypothetical protein Q8891_06795 [Bacteroidota bacterium]|nr:hypothetical protein [Bacteroidota bacterium]